MTVKFRLEHDSFGDLLVPHDALYGAQTQRAVQNFRISGQPMPSAFLRALALLKAAIAEANGQLGHLRKTQARAISQAALVLAAGEHPDQFPVDIYQTGSGTSSNMNMNEVIAGLVRRRNKLVLHPNDHINLGQSSNDVVPSAIILSAALQLDGGLLPALKRLHKGIGARQRRLSGVVKTGRTHLMDAMPITLAQELSGWSAQLGAVMESLQACVKRLQALPLGGTAVGTGVNADPRMPALACRFLHQQCGLRMRPADNAYALMAAQDHIVALSGCCNTLAVALMKISNDLRWMNSGPLTGLAEISLPALQPGSSIMPGKVNPVIPEAVAMVCARVMGNHTTLTIAGQSGNFQLNVMLPLIAHCILDSLQLLATACDHLNEKAIAGFKVNARHLQQSLYRNPILATALNPVLGYEQAAVIAKRAYAEQRPILEVALEMTQMDEAQLGRLLDPIRLTGSDRRKPRR